LECEHKSEIQMKGTLINSKYEGMTYNLCQDCGNIKSLNLRKFSKDQIVHPIIRECFERLDDNHIYAVHDALWIKGILWHITITKRRPQFDGGTGERLDMNV